MFADRVDAAWKLSSALARYRGQNPLVLAIPRGAVPMGRRIAAELGGELDVVLVRKLGAPGDPEFALGAVDESGWTFLSDFAREAGLTDSDLEIEREVQFRTLRDRRLRYTPARKPLDPAGRVVIVVDDGIATGATMIAALHAVRARHPAHLVCAVPVAARESLAMVRAYADETVCLDAPAHFGAVSAYYKSFAQVDDTEVVRLLEGQEAP